MMEILKFLNNTDVKKIDDVTYSFLNDDDLKLFDISNEEFLKFKEALKSKNWMEVAFDMFYETYPWLYKTITDSNRSDFLFLLDIKKDDLALDLGSGWGQISIPLSKFCNVVSLEGNLKKIQIIKDIANQENRNNIQYVAANIIDPIFENEQFNLIILNGVLELAGTFSNRVEDPFKIQQNMLQNAYNLLKPNGELYIGIENKYGLKYLLGEKDDYTGLEDFVYLNTDNMNSFYHSMMGRRLNSLIHGKKTYEKMLKNSGFENIKFFGTLPDYKIPKMMIDMTDNSNIQFAQENLEYFQEFDGATGRVSNLNHKLEYMYSIFHPNELANIYPSYSIIARKSND
jgi:SAM-dependent methyltransferase